MVRAKLKDLGKRERQIAEVVYRLGEANVSEVLSGIDDPPTYSTIRAMLGLLVGKGVLRVRRDGKKYVYRPATSRAKAGKSAIESLLRTFFPNQTTDAFAAMLDAADDLTDDDLDQMKKLIEQAKKENR